MRVIVFFTFAAVNVWAYFSVLNLGQDTSDPAQTILSLSMVAWLSFVLCLSIFVAGASAPSGALEPPQSVTQLILLCALFPLFGFSLGLALNLQNYQQLALSIHSSRGDEVERVDELLARLSGEIGPRTLSSLTEEQLRGEIKFLELDSIGGLVEVANEIGDFLIAHGISTFVEAECSSACVIVALSGRQLLVTQDARFGFHRGSSAADIDSELGRFMSKAATADMIETLKRRGVPQEILKRAEDTPADSMYYVTGQVMHQIGLAQRLVE